MIILDKIKKIPLIFKVVIGIIPILLLMFYSFFLSNMHTKNRELFYSQSFSSIVVSCNNSVTGRAFEFHLANGLKIYFGYHTENSIKINDSIVKENNTYIYNTYRKEANGEYLYYATYNFEKTL